MRAILLCVIVFPFIRGHTADYTTTYPFSTFLSEKQGQTRINFGFSTMKNSGGGVVCLGLSPVQVSKWDVHPR